MKEISLGILVCTAVNLVLKVKSEDGCRDLKFLNCVINKTLTGHVVSAFNLSTPALEPCQHKCFMEGKCVSYNLGPVRGQIRSCELNAADHSTRPSFFVSKEGYEYCPIRNPCSCNPCPAGRLCTPDLAWDTFNCDDGSWAQWSSWRTECFVPINTCKPNRTRTCTSPSPQKSGANCIGNAVDTAAKECLVPQIDTTGCESPLGMEDGRITDNQINASSYASFGKNTRHAQWNGRLNKMGDAKGIGGWAVGSKKMGEYIQIDLLKVKAITMVATQGRSDCCNQYVTQYSLAYSNDANNWSDYEGDCVRVFPGNFDKNTVVTNKLEVPIIARHVRLIVKEKSGWASMRMELYGCSEL